MHRRKMVVLSVSAGTISRSERSSQHHHEISAATQ
jgi:hypothetical protein